MRKGRGKQTGRSGSGRVYTEISERKGEAAARAGYVVRGGHGGGSWWWVCDDGHDGFFCCCLLKIAFTEMSGAIVSVNGCVCAFGIVIAVVVYGRREAKQAEEAEKRPQKQTRRWDEPDYGRLGFAATKKQIPSARARKLGHSIQEQQHRPSTNKSGTVTAGRRVAGGFRGGRGDCAFAWSVLEVEQVPNGEPWMLSFPFAAAVFMRCGCRAHVLGGTVLSYWGTIVGTIGMCALAVAASRRYSGTAAAGPATAGSLLPELI
jgi:hypothetical protein